MQCKINYYYKIHYVLKGGFYVQIDYLEFTLVLKINIQFIKITNPKAISSLSF
jgi:hypothetical protein